MLEKILLNTRDGQLVAVEYIQAMQPPPEVIRWGSRVFRLSIKASPGVRFDSGRPDSERSVYTEGFCYDIPQPEFWLKFHRMTAVTQEQKIIDHNKP